MTDTIEDIDFSLLDDLAPDCESHGHAGAPARATHIDMRPCHCDILKCDQCVEDTRRAFPERRKWRCAYCHATWGVGPLYKFIEVQPL